MSIDQLRKRFPDEDACRLFFDSILWKHGRACPHCDNLKSYHLSGASVRKEVYECSRCKHQFTGKFLMKIRLSIKTKIFLVILAPSLLLFFVIYLDYRNLNALGRSAELILSKNYKSIQKAQQIRQILEATQNRILSTIFLNPSNLPEIPLSIQEITKLLSDCNDNVTEPGEQKIIDTLFVEFKRYESALSNLMRALNLSNKAELDQLSYYFISVSASMNSKLNDLVLINEKAMETAEKITKQVAKSALRYSIGLLILAIIFTIVFSYLLSKRISQPLIKLAEGLSTIKEGSGDYPIIVSTSRDEIGFLTQKFNRLFERLKIYDQISQDKLTAEKLKARHAEEARARLIADLSHQLKTPMTSLSMSVGMLADKADRLKPDQRSTLFETAREDCAKLTELINELVDTARLEGMVKPRAKELIDIEALIAESLKLLLQQAKEKNILLNIDIEAGLLPLAVDSLRFPWVITNLVGNAVRYTGKGGEITLRVRKPEDRYYFTCKDTGIGIEEKYLSKIFDRFTQFSEREKSGTIGLGLAIVMEIIEQHGGDIRVESKVNQGTTFTFWIPASQEGDYEKKGTDH